MSKLTVVRLYGANFLTGNAGLMKTKSSKLKASLLPQFLVEKKWILIEENFGG